MKFSTFEEFKKEILLDRTVPFWVKWTIYKVEGRNSREIYQGLCLLIGLFEKKILEEEN